MDGKTNCNIQIEEVGKLLTAINEYKGAEGLRLRALLEILYAAGLRVTELIGLPLSTVARGNKYITVRGKGNKERVVPLTEAAQQAIEDYLSVREAFLSGAKESKYLFPSHGAEGYLTRQRFGQLLKELAAKANIDAERVSPHVIRHAFATHLLDHGMDLRSLQQLLGHADISTTQIYTHVTQSRLQHTVLTHHPLAKKKNMG
jgi:integrase/recombinase XerD